MVKLCCLVYLQLIKILNWNCFLVSDLAISSKDLASRGLLVDFTYRLSRLAAGYLRKSMLRT